MWSLASSQAFPRAPPLRAQSSTTEFRCVFGLGVGTRNAGIGTPDMAWQERLRLILQLMLGDDAGDMGVTYNDQCNQIAADSSACRALQPAIRAPGGHSHSFVLANADLSPADDRGEEPH